MGPVYTHFQTKKAHLYCLHKGVPLPGGGGGYLQYCYLIKNIESSSEWKIRSKQYTICSNCSFALYLIYSSI